MRRPSPVQDVLKARGASVYVDDPLYSANELQALGYTPLLEGYKSDICAVILQAYHTAYASLDFTGFSQCQVVLDGRRAFKREAIELLGIRYIAIGDGNSHTQASMSQQPENTFAIVSVSRNSGQK